MDNKYAKAYKEVLEIIKYFPKDEYNKIPKEKILFYQANMDKEYDFSINPSIDLDDQNISKEAKAIIVTLFQDYFASEEQKIKIKEILKLNEQKVEQEKRKKYNPDNVFKKKVEHNNTQMELKESSKALIEYKESFFAKFKKFILKILHVNN